MKKLLITIAAWLILCNTKAQTLEWAKQLGGAGYDRGMAITTDAQGNVYTGGNFDDKVDFDPGADTLHYYAGSGGEAFILKMDAGGNLIKLHTFGSAGGGHFVCVSNIGFDGAGNMYAGGYFTGSNVDFDPDTSLFRMSWVGSDLNAFIMKLDVTGKFVWAKKWFYGIDGGGGEDGPVMVTDATGNTISAGRFRGDTDFDPGDSIRKLPGKWHDGYVTKLNSDGELVWAKQLATNDSAESYVWPKSVSRDGSGNVFVAGYFLGTVDFNPDTSLAFNLTSEKTACGFIVKLDAAGEFLWAKMLGDPDLAHEEYDRAFSVVADASGNVYVTGGFMGTVAFGNTSLVSNGASDIYVAKLDGSGNFLWAKQIGSLYDAETGFKMALDAAGNVYTTGIYRGTTDFNPGGGAANLTTNGSVDVFVLKLTSTGDFVWAKGYGGPTGYEVAFAIAVNGDAVYTTGRFQGTVNFDPNGIYELSAADSGSVREDIFIHKMNQGTTGIGNISGDLPVAVYPNPASNAFIIDLTFAKTTDAVAVVLSIDGKEVKQIALTQPVTTVDVTGLQKGIYFIKVESESSRAVRKIVIE